MHVNFLNLKCMAETNTPENKNVVAGKNRSYIYKWSTHTHTHTKKSVIFSNSWRSGPVDVKVQNHFFLFPVVSANDRRVTCKVVGCVFSLIIKQPKPDSCSLSSSLVFIRMASQCWGAGGDGKRGGGVGNAVLVSVALVFQVVEGWFQRCLVLGEYLREDFVVVAMCR